MDRHSLGLGTASLAFLCFLGGPAAPQEGRPRVEFLKAMEREELQAALSSAGWVIARAAKILGWTPRQVAYKMKKHGLSSPWKK